jgi:hypothetical protein
MIDRCENVNTDGYKRYGGRGIRVCDRWRFSFESFLADMGPRPDDTSIERIDNNGNYEPGNCRWATSKEQANNRSSTRLVTIGNETMSLSEWADRNKIPYKLVRSRVHERGWDPVRAVTDPPLHCARLFVPLAGRNVQLGDLAAECGIPKSVLYQRLYVHGWTVERSITQPTRKRKV